MIQLNYRDAKPIYEQIRDGIRRLVITGVVAAGEKLPSVRELASHLAINPNTIQRAYRDLEQEGYVYRVQGKGTYAAPQMQVQDRRMEELRQQYDQVVSELLYLKVPAGILQERIDTLGKEQGDDTGK